MTFSINKFVLIGYMYTKDICKYEKIFEEKTVNEATILKKY